MQHEEDFCVHQTDWLQCREINVLPLRWTFVFLKMHKRASQIPVLLSVLVSKVHLLYKLAANVSTEFCCYSLWYWAAQGLRLFISCLGHIVKNTCQVWPQELTQTRALACTKSKTKDCDSYDTSNEHGLFWCCLGTWRKSKQRDFLHQHLGKNTKR